MSKSIGISVQDKDIWILDAIDKLGDDRSTFFVKAAKLYLAPRVEMVKQEAQTRRIALEAKHASEMGAFMLEFDAIMSSNTTTVQSPIQTILPGPVPGAVVEPSNPAPDQGNQTPEQQFWKGKVPLSDPIRSYEYAYRSFVTRLNAPETRGVNEEMHMSWLERFGPKVDTEELYEVLMKRAIAENVIKERPK